MGAAKNQLPALLAPWSVPASFDPQVGTTEVALQLLGQVEELLAGPGPGSVPAKHWQQYLQYTRHPTS
jgi:hypothetical protein